MLFLAKALLNQEPNRRLQAAYLQELERARTARTNGPPKLSSTASSYSILLRWNCEGLASMQTQVRQSRLATLQIARNILVVDHFFVAPDILERTLALLDTVVNDLESTRGEDHSVRLSSLGDRARRSAD